jgi:hypothetical protein
LNGIHTDFWRNHNKGHCPAAAQNVSPGIMRMRTAVTVGLDSVTLELGHVYQKQQNLTNLLNFISTISFPQTNLTHECVCF